jgi:hypothetical protein
VCELEGPNFNMSKLRYILPSSCNFVFANIIECSKDTNQNVILLFILTKGALFFSILQQNELIKLEV